MVVVSGSTARMPRSRVLVAEDEERIGEWGEKVLAEDGTT